jgi:hypothetical protein
MCATSIANIREVVAHAIPRTRCPNTLDARSAHPRVIHEVHTFQRGRSCCDCTQLINRENVKPVFGICLGNQVCLT